MDEQNILLEKKDRIAYVTINRPKALNALNQSVLNDLHQLFTDLKEDKEVWGVILTGSGEKAFVAGADIKEMELLDESQAQEFSRIGQKTFMKIETFSKPVIAAVNGFALGGGCELAMACHIRIASVNAKFGQPEVSLGLIPGFGGTQRLPRLVGSGKALEMILTGEMITAETAATIGLVQKVVNLPELMPTVETLMKKILERAPLSLKRCIKAVHLGMQSSIEEGMNIENQLFGKMFSTKDSQEGMKAFIEKRPAQFKGE